MGHLSWFCWPFIGEQSETKHRRRLIPAARKMSEAVCEINWNFAGSRMRGADGRTQCARHLSDELWGTCIINVWLGGGLASRLRNNKAQSASAMNRKVRHGVVRIAPISKQPLWQLWSHIQWNPKNNRKKSTLSVESTLALQHESSTEVIHH